MEKTKKQSRYQRLFDQTALLLTKCDDPIAQMATVAAILKNKMEHHFWCGFYRVDKNRLIVAPYQGSVACQVLEGGGVCWEAVNLNQTVVVPDVHEFPGHIACDSRSNSEIVVPIRNKNGEVVAVLDVDSDKFSAFDEVDAFWLEKIAALISIGNSNLF